MKFGVVNTQGCFYLFWLIPTYMEMSCFSSNTIKKGTDVREEVMMECVCARDEQNR